MKILRLLSRKYLLVVIILLATDFCLQAEEQPVDIWNIDKKELEFLRFNLEYGHKCRKSFFNSNGFKIGSSKYKNCVLNKGRKNNG